MKVVKDNSQPGGVPTRAPGKMRVTVEYIDSYHRDGGECKKDVWEGEDVGVNIGLNSTIAIPLCVERIKKEDGTVTGEKTIFLAHTFIKNITFERVD